MSINCKSVGKIPFVLHPGDEFLVDFDISSWLDGSIINSVEYSATDEYGENVESTVLPGGSGNSASVVRPYIAGGVNNNSYTVKMLVEADDLSKKAFYLKWQCREVAS